LNAYSSTTQISMRSFCEDFQDLGFGQQRGGFQRRPREGFQRRPRPDASHIVIIRGLGEGKENEAEVKRIFPGADIIPDGVKVLKDSRGKSLNAVFVEFSTVEEATRAVDAYRETVRGAERNPDVVPISVRTATVEERQAAISAAPLPNTYINVKRVPYSITEEEVKNIFTGLNVVSVTVGNGSATIKFATVDDAARALEKNGTEFGRRPIVVAPGLELDFKFSEARPPKVIRVRGAPSSATEQDFRKFFDGLDITRFNATSREGIAGRIVPGDVFIEFSSADDAVKALKMDRQNMGDRYLQIYRSAVRERQNRINPNRNQPQRGGAAFGGFNEQPNFGEQQH